VATGDHLFDLHGHPTQLSDINYDDAGHLISTCLEQIRVWNIHTGACIKAINFGSDCGKGIAYRSPLIATGSDNGVIKTWNLETGQCVTTSTGNSARILHLATSPHHQIVATCKDDGTLSLWNFAELAIVRDQLPPVIHFPAHRGMATYLIFSPNGQLIASTGSDRLIQIWDAMTGGKIQTLTGHTDYIAQLLFIDDRTMLSRSYDGTTRQWDLTTGCWKSLDYLPQQGRWVMSLAQSPTGRSIVFGSRTPSITIFDRDNGTTQTYPATGNRLRQLAFSHDGKFLVGITDDRILNLWEVNRNYHHCAWSIGDRDQGSILPHPTLAHRLIIGTDDGKISIWDLQDRVCLDQIAAHNRDILAIGIVPHPQRLVSCSLDGSIKIWELADARLTEQIYSIESDTPYQNLQLSGVKGLNRSQLDTLVRLGATT
jgi:WD40 repeat protein